MTPKQVRALPPKLLTKKQREFYFENGYLDRLETIVPAVQALGVRYAGYGVVDAHDQTKADSSKPVQGAFMSSRPSGSRLRGVTTSACLKSPRCQSSAAMGRFRIRHRPLNLGVLNRWICSPKRSLPLVADRISCPGRSHDLR